MGTVALPLNEFLDIIQVKSDERCFALSQLHRGKPWFFAVAVFANPRFAHMQQASNLFGVEQTRSDRYRACRRAGDAGLDYLIHGFRAHMNPETEMVYSAILRWSLQCAKT